MAQSIRTLTDEEKEKLAKDATLVSEFKRNKFEQEAQKNWDIFYKRNTTKFFKDRHWTRREFADLVNSSSQEPLVIFEVGCGVGNFMFPLIEEDKNLYFYACDFSQRAVQFVKENPCYDPSHCTVFHCDIVHDDLTKQVPDRVVDVATMIFVLSAIHPDKMETALKKIHRTLKPGGCLLIRDYGLYDHAMLRFAPGHKLSENFYVRQDGTRAYYFSLEVLESLMRSSGFEVSSSEYIQRQTVNRKEGLEVPRIFVQGKFVRPSEECDQISGCGKQSDKCLQCDRLGRKFVEINLESGNKSLSEDNGLNDGAADNCGENSEICYNSCPDCRTDLSHEDVEDTFSKLSTDCRIDLRQMSHEEAVDTISKSSSVCSTNLSQQAVADEFSELLAEANKFTLGTENDGKL